jgi:uncharacterized membrane protein
MLEFLAFLVLFGLAFEVRSRIGRIDHRLRLLEDAVRTRLRQTPGDPLWQAPVVATPAVRSVALEEVPPVIFAPVIEAPPPVTPAQAEVSSVPEAEAEAFPPTETPAFAGVTDEAGVAVDAEVADNVVNERVAEPDDLTSAQAGVSVEPEVEAEAILPTETPAFAGVTDEAALTESVAEDPAPPPPPAIPMGKRFEDLFGRRLPIWAGGITLAVAGFLIVKYAIDMGLFGRIFTPWVQALSGFLFGTGLIAGAEFAHRNQERVADPRVGQALSGAGIATLYAVFLVAGNVYGLIGPLAAFLGLAAVTVAALGLSIRHGAPSALLGLAGGLAAPAMVGGISANVPLLAVYLAFTIAGLSGVSRMQRWPWLGLAALVGGAGWSLWMIIASNALDLFASLSIGGFVILTAIALPMLALDGARAAFMRAVAALVGAAQLALLVAMGGFAPLHWGLFALLAAAGQWLAWRDRNFEIVPTISLGLSVFLLAVWPEPGSYWLSLIGLSLAAIHAVPLLLKLWQKPVRVQRALELCGLAAAAPLLVFHHFWRADGSQDFLIASVAAAAALLPAIAMALGWRDDERRGDTRFGWLATTTGALAFATCWFALPDWQASLALGVIAVALLFFGKSAQDPRIERIASGFVAASLPFIALPPSTSLDEVFALFNGRDDGLGLTSLLRWGGLAAVFAIFAWRGLDRPMRSAAQLTAAALAYGAMALLLPAWTLPLALAAIASVVLIISRRSADGFGRLNANYLAIATLPLLVVTMLTGPAVGFEEAARLFRGHAGAFDLIAVLRWGGLTALACVFARFALGQTSRIMAHWFAAILAYGLFAQIVPDWALAIVMAGVTAILLAIGLRRDEPVVEGQAAMLALISVAWLMLTGHDPAGEWVRLIGLDGQGTNALSALRWAAVAGLGGLFAARARVPGLRPAGQGAAALLAYGALAQVLPIGLVPLIAPVGIAGVAFASRKLGWQQVHIALIVLTAVVAGWAIMPLAWWLTGALGSLGGIPMMIDPATLGLAIVLKQLLLPAMLVGLALWRVRDQAPRWWRIGWLAIAAVNGGVALHILYRLGFAGLAGSDFAHTGLGERTLWEALLIALGYGLWRRGRGLMQTAVAPAVVAAATLHGFWYGLVLHNPLWSAQAVGPIPVVNLTLPAFAAVPLGLWLLRAMLPGFAVRTARSVEPVHMAMLLLFAWATLRQAFHGSWLAEPGVSSFEDIARSILGIALAIGFLLWGIRAQRRDWRIASLALMLVATVKVFLLDASGLEGLLRIGSFVALGFSLIGIGWLYSRQLGRDDAAAIAPEANG